MATITGGGFNTTLDVGANDANGVAQALTNQINAALANGTLTPPGAAPSPGVPTLQQITQAGTTTMDAGAGAVVIQAPGAATLFGNGFVDKLILAGNGPLTFGTGGGSGSVVTGDGDNTLYLDGAGHAAATGAGNDTVISGSGNNTVAAGGGNMRSL